jgi:uncharacterized protein YfaS (alpha-2-macroglobulin family)
MSTMNEARTAARSPLAWSLALVLGFALACTGGSGDVIDGPSPDGPTEEAVESESAGTPDTTPTSLAALRPTFDVIASEGVAPRKLVIRFGYDVVEASQVADQAAIAGPVPVLEPAVPGTWSWTSPHRLVFRPEVGFAANTAYEVKLASLQTRWGTLAGDFAHAFETPAFEPVEVQRGLVHNDYVDIDVAFSGPVDPSSASKVVIRVDGVPIPKTLQEAGRNNVLRFRVQKKDLRQGSLDVDVRVDSGTVSLVDGSVRGGPLSKTLELDTTVKPMEIRQAKLAESADGWYLDVLCHDASVGDAEYYWDQQTYESWYVSERCVLSADALDNVVFSPEVADLYVAEARRGFRVFGTFPQGEVSVTMPAGTYTADGGILQEAWTQTFTVRPRSPRTELVAKQGRYLPRGAWGNLPVKHLNTDAIDVTIRRVPPQNLVFWLSGDDEDATRRTSDLIAEKRIAVENPEDRVKTTWIDVGSLVGEDLQGLFEIEVAPVADEAAVAAVSDDEQVDTGWAARQARDRELERLEGTGDTSRLVLTDLQLVAKMDERPAGASYTDRITAFALEAESNAAVGGVDIDAVRPSGFVMATCRTGSDGACVLEMPPADVDETDPIALIARKGDDLTYLKFADLETPISEVDVGGERWTSETPYTASLYADRGVYRPGDTVHFGSVLRGDDHQAPAQALPVVVSVYDPRGKLAKQAPLTTNDAGMTTYDLALPAFAPTGSWSAQLEVGGNTVQSLDFAVEEFVPERMKVEATMRGDGLRATETATVDVAARYLFGGSAEGSRVDVSCSIKPGRFRPKKNTNLHYGRVFVGTDEPPRETVASSESAVLDADGEGSVPCGGLSDGYPVTGTLIADVAVFEAGSGRSTRGRASVPVHPADYYIGLDTGTEKAGRGTDIRFTGKVVDWEGAAGTFTDAIDVTLYRLEEEYGWWWWGDRSEESYDLYLRRVQEDVRRVEVGSDGSFSFTYTPRSDAAGYLVRASSGGARTDFRIEGERRRYAWSGGDSQVDRTPRPAKPTSIQVVLPEEIAVGERNVARLQVPFDGRILMTVETDSLLTYEWLDVEAGQAEWPFAVEAWVPNVYVSAFLVKDPHLDSPEGYAPERAFGVANVAVRPDAYRYDVALSVPDSVRSNSTLTVDLNVGQAGDGTWVTVAAVDEGILQLTDFESPDVVADVFPRRRLGIRTFETVGWSVLMPAGSSSEHGGDGMGAAGRVQPVKPVALWSGPVQTDAQGKARITLDVPQYRGELRVMAVAAGKERVGSADASVTVRDPLVLQTTLPRFLTQNDTFQIPVFVTNMSGQDRDILVEMTAEYLPWPGMPDDPNAPSPIAFLGERKATIRVADGKSQTVAFQAKATALVGAATFQVRVSSDGLESYERLDVPFAPSGPKSRETQQVKLTAGALDLDPYLADWLPTTEKSTLWVTPNPYGRAMGHLKHVVRYPHGCIEQTTSSTRPLLYVRNLVPALMPELAGDELEKMVMHGVDRVLSMQTPSGGFGYWPGSRSPTAWGSAYATHMLLDAKAQQYDVPQDRIDDALDYLEDTVRQSESSARGFDRYRYSEPYTHFVLAKAGRGKKARVQTLLDRMDDDNAKTGEDLEARYLLQAALYLAGDRRFEKQLKAPDASTLTNVRRNGWSFYSDLRRRGFALSVYHDLFGDGMGQASPEAQQLAKVVANGLESQKSSYYTTQEIVWGITGLGKHVAGAGADFKGLELTAGGTVLEPEKPGKGPKRHDQSWAVPRASERDLTLNLKNAKGDLYLVLTSEGVKQNATYRTGGQGLQVTRSYKTADGMPVDLARVQLGDVVYTEITVRNTTSERIQNIALVDRFVAGWEIENPRLGRGGVVDWIDPSEQWEADHMNLRDDRLELFGALESGQSRTVTYALRAVTAGEFTSPPVEAEAMYDPSLWARQPGGKVVVEGPWADVLL